MRFHASPLAGAWIIELERIEDDRGWFARSFDIAEFRARGLAAQIVQANTSFNLRSGTLRGMHYQATPTGRPSSCAARAGASST